LILDNLYSVQRTVARLGFGHYYAEALRAAHSTRAQFGRHYQPTTSSSGSSCFISILEAHHRRPHSCADHHSGAGQYQQAQLGLFLRIAGPARLDVTLARIRAIVGKEMLAAPYSKIPTNLRDSV